MRLLLIGFYLLMLTVGSSQGITEHLLSSQFLGADRQLRVFLPEGYPHHGPYQVVYTFDADWLFELTWPNTHYLSGPATELFPEAIVVGIHFGEDRNEDMDLDWDTGTLGTQGQAFVQYVKEEVIPFIEETYQTSPFRTIVGHSNSSTFLDFFLLHEDGPVFNGYIALSQFHLESIARRLADFFKEEGTQPIYYYLASGADDAPYRLESGHQYAALWDSLAQEERFHFRHDVYDLAEHMSVAPMGIPAGLRFVNQDYFSFGQMDGNAVQQLRQPDFNALEFWQTHLDKMEVLYGRPYELTIADAYVWFDVLPDRPDGTELIEIIGQQFLTELPDQGELRIVMGTAYGKLGQLPRAEALFQEGIKLQQAPDFYTYFWPFQCYEQLGLLTEAIRYADLGLAVFTEGSTRARLLYQRAKLAAKYGLELKEGLACIEAYRAFMDGGGQHTFIDPEWVLLRHGQILGQLDRKQEAKHCFQQALEFNPDFTPALEALTQYPSN